MQTQFSKKKMETKLKELRDAIKTVNYKHLFLSVSYFWMFTYLQNLRYRKIYNNTVLEGFLKLKLRIIKKEKKNHGVKQNNNKMFIE